MPVIIVLQTVFLFSVMSTQTTEGELLDFDTSTTKNSSHTVGELTPTEEVDTGSKLQKDHNLSIEEGCGSYKDMMKNVVKLAKDPLETLPKEKLKLISVLRKIVDTWKLEEPEREELKSDYTLYRYLHGYGYDMKQVPSFLHSMISWRAKYKPQNIRLKNLKFAHKMFVFQKGFDLEGHPVVYMVLKNDDVPNTEENKKEKVFVLIWLNLNAVFLNY